MKTCRGRRGTLTLDGGQAPANLPQGELRYPLNRRLGGPPSWSGRSGAEIRMLPPPGFESELFSHSLITILTTLH